MVKASVGSPASPRNAETRSKGKPFQSHINTYMMSVIWYAMYLPLVIVEMGIGHGKSAA